MMFLKYQLPSEPNVYVDLLDDEDVSLMFDEVGTSPPPSTAVRRHSHTVISQKYPDESVNTQGSTLDRSPQQQDMTKKMPVLLTHHNILSLSNCGRVLACA